MKKEARDAVRKMLEAQQEALRIKISNNKFAIRKLVQEQQRMKRQLPEYNALIRSLL